MSLLLNACFLFRKKKIGKKKKEKKKFSLEMVRHVKDGSSNCQKWRLHLSKMEVSNMEASNCQKFGHQPSIFSSLLGSLILATSLLFLL